MRNSQVFLGILSGTYVLLFYIKIYVRFGGTYVLLFFINFEQMEWYVGITF